MLNFIRDKYNKYFVTFVHLASLHEIVCEEIVSFIVLEMLINVYSLDMHNRLHYSHNSVFFINN